MAVGVPYIQPCFPRSKISFENSFAQKCYIVTVLNFFLEHISQNQTACTFTFMRFFAFLFLNIFFWSVLVRTRKSALLLSCIFWLGHLLRSKINFESSFLIKCYIFTRPKKNLEYFRQNQKTCTFTFLLFLVGALPEVKNPF